MGLVGGQSEVGFQLSSFLFQHLIHIFLHSRCWFEYFTKEVQTISIFIDKMPGYFHISAKGSYKGSSITIFRVTWRIPYQCELTICAPLRVACAGQDLHQTKPCLSYGSAEQGGGAEEGLGEGRLPNHQRAPGRVDYIRWFPMGILRCSWISPSSISELIWPTFCPQISMGQLWVFPDIW